MQIAFLTLFLGLVTGPQTVELTAGPGTAAVELVLDGSSVTMKLGQPPWSATIDLGREILPHHLEARALAADGSELCRAEQWLNLPRPPAEVEIVLEGSAAARTRTARLAWDSLTGEAPSEMHLSLDGVPLALDAQARAPLVIPRAGNAHVLSAELHFQNGAEARKDVVLTGDYDGDVATELTAVPVRTAGKPGAALAERDLQDRFLADGHPAKVTAVERERAEVFLVRAAGAETALFGNATRVNAAAFEFGHFKPDKQLLFHFVSPVAKHSYGTGVASEVFDISQGVSLPGFDMLHLLLAIRFHLVGRPQLADAVAVAGLRALARQTPRAVVLVAGRGDGGADASLFDPATVRGYLAAIGVPFFVWSIGNYGLRQEAWGKVEDISTPWGLRHAYERLEKEVLAQQIVWLQGRHLPQSITLARAGAGAGPGKSIELVSTPRAP